MVHLFVQEWDKVRLDFEKNWSEGTYPGWPVCYFIFILLLHFVILKLISLNIYIIIYIFLTYDISFHVYALIKKLS